MTIIALVLKEIVRKCVVSDICVISKQNCFVVYHVQRPSLPLRKFFEKPGGSLAKVEMAVGTNMYIYVSKCLHAFSLRSGTDSVQTVCEK